MDIFSLITTYVLSILLGYIIFTKILKIVSMQRLIPLLFLPVVLAFIGKRIKIISIDFFNIWFDHFMIGLAIGLLLGFVVIKTKGKKQIANYPNS